MPGKNRISGIFFALPGGGAFAGAVLDQVPAHPDSGTQNVVYLPDDAWVSPVVAWIRASCQPANE